MKKALKWFLISVGVIIVIVIAALLIIPSFVDVQKYKPEIERRVAEATGRPFSLGGDLRISLFPWVGLTLSDLHLGNPPGFEEKEFLSVKAFEVRVKLLPLLSKNIQVKRFVLEGPRIVLERGKDGRGNWEGIGKTEKIAPPKEAPEEPEKRPQEGLPIEALTVGEFTIKDGYLLWSDHTTNERREITNLDLSLKDVSLDQPIRATLSARLDDRPILLDGEVGPVGKEPGKGTLPLDISLQALEQLELNLKGHLVDVTVRPEYDLTLQISPFSARELFAALGQTFPVITSDPEALNRISMEAHIQGTQEAVAISQGVLDMDDSHLTFTVNAREFSRPDVAFQLNLDEMNLDRYLPAPTDNKGEREIEKIGRNKKERPSNAPGKTDFTPLRRLVLDGSVKVGKITIRGAEIRDIHLEIVGKDGVFQLDPLSLKLPEGSASAKGRFDVSQEVPRFDLALQVPTFSPRKLFEVTGQPFPIETPDPNALTRISFDAHIQGSTEDITVKDGTLELDESHLSFSANAKDLGKPDVKFILDLDQIDLDRYLPLPEEGPAEGKPKKKAKPGKKESTPEKRKPDYAPLRKVVLDGTIRMGKLKARGAEIEDLHLKVTGADGVIRIDPFELKLYEGAAMTKGTFNVQQDVPRAELELKASGIQVEPLLKDFMKKDFLGGTMQADLALRMQGDEANQIKRTLNGQGELLFEDGYIRGIDLAGMVRNVKASFGLAERVEERPRTDFSELRSPFTLTNGLFETQKTRLMSPLLRIWATGKADLSQETLDFHIGPKFVGTLKGQGDTMERSGVMVPVLVGGTFSSPTFRPDLEGLIKQGIGEVQLPDLKEGLPKPSDLKEGLPEVRDLEKALPVPPELKEGLPELPATEEGVSTPTEAKEAVEDQATTQPKTEKRKAKKKRPESLEEKAQDLIKSLPTGD
jgi:AsmA protein